jgi:hypothetical protein
MISNAGGERKSRRGAVSARFGLADAATTVGKGTARRKRGMRRRDTRFFVVETPIFSGSGRLRRPLRSVRGCRNEVPGRCPLTFGWLGVVLLVSALALYLAVRVAEVVHRWREPTTRWVSRSRVDRRRRSVPVAIERRCGPRRQEDVARAYLAALPRRRFRSRSSDPPSVARHAARGR